MNKITFFLPGNQQNLPITQSELKPPGTQLGCEKLELFYPNLFVRGVTKKLAQPFLTRGQLLHIRWLMHT